jgi:hypothetical protein
MVGLDFGSDLFFAGNTQRLDSFHIGRGFIPYGCLRENWSVDQNGKTSDSAHLWGLIQYLSENAAAKS